jgi:hypothetical protein
MIALNNVSDGEACHCGIMKSGSSCKAAAAGELITITKFTWAQHRARTVGNPRRITLISTTEESK